MKRTKQEKGITLIALIITIVVLLILAVVAISSIKNDGILSYAGNAATEYNKSVENEQSTLVDYEDVILRNDPSRPKAPTTLKGISISGTSFTVQAEGGTAIKGEVKYQYSVDGNNWSDEVASGENYIFTDLFADENKTSWTVYARTVDESKKESAKLSLTVIKCYITDYGFLYAIKGWTWNDVVDNRWKTNGGKSLRIGQYAVGPRIMVNHLENLDAWHKILNSDGTDVLCEDVIKEGYVYGQTWKTCTFCAGWS